MPWWFWLLVAFIVIASYVAATSNRLDRLHARLDAARAALDAQLVRRSAVTLEIAASGLLDPATSVLLASAAHEARASSGDEREIGESELTGALRAAFADPDVDNEVKTVAVQSDGKLLIGGGFTNVGGQARHYLARLDADGALDASFADPDLNGAVWTIAVQPDGQVLGVLAATDVAAALQR